MSNAILSIMCDVYKLENTTVSDMLTAFFCPHYDMKHASIKTQKNILLSTPRNIHQISNIYMNMIFPMITM